MTVVAPLERVPRILVGSSKEGLPVAHALKELLAPEIDLHLWTDSFFTAGEYAVETLEDKSKAFDGALVVGTSDDRVISRGEEAGAIRDNLLFEFGMFVALFGRRRAILALEGLGATRLPSDLFGLTCVGFSRSEPLKERLAPAAVEIRRVIQGLPMEVLDPELMQSLEDVLDAFIGDLQEALGSPPRVGLHLWVIDQRLTPPRLVRVARSRTVPKAPLDKEFAKGEGVVGECWRTATAVAVDYSEEPYRSIQETEWNDFGAGVRRGMDYPLLSRSRERYRIVGATPVISSLSSGTQFLGCLSYNVGPNVDALGTNSRPLDLEILLDRCVEIVRILLGNQ